MQHAASGKFISAAVVNMHVVTHWQLFTSNLGIQESGIQKEIIQITRMKICHAQHACRVLISRKQKKPRPCWVHFLFFLNGPL